MTRAPERSEDFRRFVEVHWFGLVRSAYLLVGDRAAAEDLVQSALARAQPDWDRLVREGAPVASVRNAMVDQGISTLRRTRLRETLGAWWDGRPSAQEPGTRDAHSRHPLDAHAAVGDPAVDDPGVAVRALWELPPRTRAILVLRCVDGLTEAATAEAIGVPLGAVKRQTVRGVQHLRTAMETGAVAGDDVRTALLAATEGLPVPPEPYRRVMATVTERRRRRHSVVAATGVAAVVLAGLAGLVSGATDGLSRVITPAPDRITGQLRMTDPVIGPELDWPVRGELGTDPAFAAEFDRALGADHRLLYAEDAEAGQVVIAISSRGDTVVFRGPPDAAVEDLERFVGLSAASRDITVAVPVSGGHVVIALMPDHLRYAQLSLPSVGRDGSVYRVWRQMPVRQGVGRVVTADPIGTVRVRTPVGDGAVHVVAGPFHEPGTLACDDCDGSWVVQRGPSQFREEAAAAVGASVEDVAVRVLLDATVPAAGGRIVSYVAEVPTGGLLRATYVVADRGRGEGSLWMVEPLRPLPVFDAGRPFVFTAQPSGDPAIVAPAAHRISFSPIGDAPALPDVRLTDGVGFVADLPPDVASYRLLAYEADGSLIGGWHGSVLRLDDPLQVR